MWHEPRPNGGALRLAGSCGWAAAGIMPIAFVFMT